MFTENVVKLFVVGLMLLATHRVFAETGHRNYVDEYNSTRMRVVLNSDESEMTSAELVSYKFDHRISTELNAADYTFNCWYQYASDCATSVDLFTDGMDKLVRLDLIFPEDDPTAENITVIYVFDNGLRIKRQFRQVSSLAEARAIVSSKDEDDRER